MMKAHNLYRALAAICATAASVVVNANYVYAGSTTANVDFAGNVNGNCTFNSIQAATLLTSGPNSLVSNYKTGSAGRATVSCTASTGTVTITDPSLVSGPALPSGTVIGAWLDPYNGGAGGTTVAASPAAINAGFVTGNPTSTTVNNTSTSYFVNFRADSPTAFPQGTYNFRTTLTATY
jgi:hypothetical protein